MTKLLLPEVDVYAQVSEGRIFLIIIDYWQEKFGGNRQKSKFRCLALCFAARKEFQVKARTM